MSTYKFKASLISYITVALDTEPEGQEIKPLRVRLKYSVMNGITLSLDLHSWLTITQSASCGGNGLYKCWK